MSKGRFTVFLGESGIETVRTKLWGSCSVESIKSPLNTYVELQSAVAGFIQGSDDDTSTVYCVDFSELFPLANYSSSAANNFTFGGLLKTGNIGGSQPDDAKWKKLDLSIKNQLLFDTEKPICITNSHLQEMLRVTRAIQSGLMEGRMTLRDIQAMTINSVQLGRIESWLQDVEEKKNDDVTVKEYEMFLETFIPSWTINRVRDTVRSAGTQNVFQAIYRESMLKTFSDGERSIFSALKEKDPRTGSLLDGFWDHMKGRDQSELYETIYNELFEVFYIAGGREDIARADAMALADLHMVNEYCDENNIPQNFKLLTRTPYLLRAQAFLPPGLLNVVIRHPAIIPEIYGYSPAQIESAKELVGHISAAIAEYDKRVNIRADKAKLETRLAEMIKNFTSFLINSNLVKDWTDDSSNSVAQKIAVNTMESTELESKINAFKKFFQLLSESLLQGESVIYEKTNSDYKRIEKEAADDRLARRIKLVNGIDIFSTKLPIVYKTPDNSNPTISAYLITTPKGYMSPGFRLFDSELVTKMGFSGGSDSLFNSFKVSGLKEGNEFWRILEDYQSTLEAEYGFLRWPKIKRCFRLLRQGKQKEFLEVLNKKSSSRDHDKLHLEFESALVKYLSLHQLKAYYYAILMQHRYAAIICSEPLRTLSGGSTEVKNDIGLFESLSSCIKDRRVFLCFKELLLLRQYCERAHGFDTEIYNHTDRMNHEMAEVILQKDKPYLHFSRADRDLHYADLCHRLAMNNTIHEAAEYEFDDVRIPLCRHAGYLENYLKEMQSISSERELLVGIRRVFWTSASNALSLDKISKYLKVALENIESGTCSSEYSSLVNAHYLRHQISRAYHINLTVFLVLLSDSRITQLDAFLDPYKALRHVDILGFIQVFDTKDKYIEFTPRLEANEPFSSKTRHILPKFIKLIQSIDNLRRTMLNGENCRAVDEANRIKYLDILKGLQGLLSSSVPNKDKDLDLNSLLRERSFYTVLARRLIERINDKITTHKLQSNSL